MTDAVFLAILVRINDNHCGVYMQISAIGHIYPGMLNSTLVNDTVHDSACFS